MPERIEWQGHRGLPLVGDGFGDPSAPPVILLHGGGQTRHAWGQTGEALAAAGYYAVTLDMRGHGESGWDPDGDYLLETFAADLLEVSERYLSTAPAVVGASLGGLTALLAQQRAPQALRAVVLVDVAPRMDPQGVMRIVSFMSASLSEGFDSLEDAADAISRFLPHRPRPKDLSGLSKNLRLCDDGRYRWHWDPKFVMRDGEGDPAMNHDRLAEAARAIRVPTLLVRGKLSDVLTAEAAREFMELVPHAEYVDVADAAHMIAGDKNDAFTDAVARFLDRVDSGEDAA